ncbi:nucleotidyl transferase AbiEii/AbiGii toxin family protein [Castellaniella caeni]|uniref:nucleotidyl transferase AbiEii/AbiGii toxin family protein n=1 Tax=Castellaniella caeni TaxID=266123 RepID=UPI000835A85B|nr:nucleotidyl transferase AbiEii/AbiGii toxin family protein [Castellaniella caeni]
MREAFNELVYLAMREPGRAHMRAVIEKELLHYDILFALSQGKLLDKLTFQGGTSLRLCHGAPRFSEDLDFAGGSNFELSALRDIKACLEDYLSARYGLLIQVKEPKVRPLIDVHEGGGPSIGISKWQISIQTSPDRPDIPRQRIKLEVANVPAYTRELKSLARNYQFLPDGYSDVLVGVETMNEIMADKLVSLPSCARYVRHRDIWDLRWLQQRGAVLSSDMVANKVSDYGEPNYLERLRKMIDRLPQITQSAAFKDEMSRFLPQDVQNRTIGALGFDAFLANEVGNMLAEVEIALMPLQSLDDRFRM